MAIRHITETTDGLRALGPYSLATVAENGSVKVAGQIGITPEGTLPEGIGPQTEQALRNVVSILGEMGIGLDRVTMVNARLADTALAGEFNQAYGAFLGEGPYPARETIEAGIPYPGALVELTAEGWLQNLDW